MTIRTKNQIHAHEILVNQNITNINYNQRV